jgi:hypothetical protein
LRRVHGKLETCRVVTTVDQDASYVKEQIVLTAPSLLEFPMIALVGCVYVFSLPFSQT